MNRIVLFALPFTLLACNENASLTEKTDTVEVKTVTVPVDPAVQKLNDLKNLSPLGLDELTAWLPAQVTGLKRTNLSMSNNVGYGEAYADYEKNRKTDMRISVYDCAGESGANLYNRTYASKLQASQDTTDGYTKVVDFRGGKAIEHFEKSTNLSSFTFMGNERIMVTITGRNFEPAALKEAAEGLQKKS